MKRLLVTGATGFVGRETLRPALEAGFEVHGICNSRMPISFDADVAWSHTDLRDPNAVDALIQRIRPTHILHAAWVTEHGIYWTSPDNLDWLAASARLLQAFVRVGGHRFVAVGTCAEYDWTGNGRMIEGVTPERPSTFYGHIKLSHHLMLMAAAEQFGFSAATGRLFFLFGPHESPKRIISYACKSLASGNPAMFSSCLQRRDFLPVAYAARGLVALLNSDLTGAVNVSSGFARPLREIISIIGEIAHRPDLLQFDKALDRPGDPPLLVGDCKLLLATGWHPPFGLGDSLRELFSYYLNIQSDRHL